MFTLRQIPEPTWLTMPQGVRLLVDEPSALVMDAARDEIIAARIDAEDEAEDKEAAPQRISSHVWVGAIAPRVIRDWEGVGDDKGRAVEPTREWIAALMRDDRMCQAFWRKYVLPVLTSAEEGNG